jgi:hypothetical protein
MLENSGQSPSGVQGSIEAGILGIDPLAPVNNFYYLWWWELLS